MNRRNLFMTFLLICIFSMTIYGGINREKEASSESLNAASHIDRRVYFYNTKTDMKQFVPYHYECK